MNARAVRIAALLPLLAAAALQARADDPPPAKDPAAMRRAAGPVLIRMSQMGQDGMVEKVLLQFPEAIHDTDARGRTALHAAAEADRSLTAEYLLDHGASIDVKDSDGATPMLLAVRAGKRDVVRLLVERGADAGIPDSAGITPAKAGAGNIDFEDAFAEVPLRAARRAAAAGDLETVKKLLAADPSLVKASGVRRETLLHAAVKGDHRPIVESLLGLGADAKARNAYEETLLFVAQSRVVAGLLVAKGADPKAVNNIRETALHHAWHLGVAQFLVEQGVDINAVSVARSTALDAVDGLADDDVLEFLKSKGAKHASELR